MQNTITEPRAWDFVEEFYPKYHSADEIAENDDLQKIVDGQLEEGENAFDLFENFKETHGTEKIAKEFEQQLLHKSYHEIYELSIIRFLEEQEAKEVQKTYYLFGDLAVKTYCNDEFETLIEEINDYTLTSSDYSTFEFIEGQTKSVEFAQAFDGWREYAIITEEQYNQINEI